MVLAFWTAAMAAREGLTLQVITSWATDLNLTRLRGTAATHRANGLLLFGREPVAITGHERIVVLFKKRGEFHGYTLLKSTCKVFTRRLMTEIEAASVVGVSCA
jgi:hypothetical protein